MTDSDPKAANRDPSKEAPDASPSSRYRFRADLEIVRNGDADAAESDVTVTDVRSGTQHVLTADEFRLCRAADGSSTLAAIRKGFTVETGRDISHGKLFAFFAVCEAWGCSKKTLPTVCATNKRPQLRETFAGRLKRAPQAVQIGQRNKINLLA